MSRSPRANSAGGPSGTEQQLNATVIGPSRLQHPDQFGAILLKVNPDGSQVRMRDVARVELGAENYATQGKFNGHPASGLAVKLATGANALETADNVRATIARLEPLFPRGLKAIYPYDTTPFIKLSIEEVVKTLFEAIFLVFLVMFVFLQNLRATLIPDHRGAGRAAWHVRHPETGRLFHQHADDVRHGAGHRAVGR